MPKTDLDYDYYDNNTFSKEYDYTSEEDQVFFRKVSFTFYGTIFILGIIGNGLVIWIAGFRMKKTISAVWFLHLAIADFLCCASLPLRMAQWANIYSQMTTSAIFCMSIIILFTINMSASVLLLTGMSIDRCVSVMWPFWAKVHRTRRLVRITAGGIWGLSLLLTGLLIYIYIFKFYDINEWCTYYFIINIHTNLKHTSQLIRLLMMFVIPFLIILTSYVMIFLKVRSSKRPQRSQRPYRIIIAVILCFFICWSPYYIWPLIPSYYKLDFIVIKTMYTIIIILSSLNSCINPIIYVFMGQDFRQGFFSSIPARLERALSDHPDDSSREQDSHEHTRTTDV
ncbi:formyl peptide receptor 2-like [Leptodactylus fuscus]|uniref:formyl peptide receptor 2-like n=1 Tax=Leptodactylus fuscus TaxID=238119 RepID=UPI003F4EE5B9